MITLSGGTVVLAHSTALCKYTSAPLTYGLPALSYAQYPIGILTTLKPAEAIFWKSSNRVQVSQCWRRMCGASSGRRSVNVYSSTISRDWSRLSKIEGVIHGSRTSHPPILTPRISVVPQTKLLSGKGDLVHEISRGMVRLRESSHEQGNCYRNGRRGDNRENSALDSHGDMSVK